MAEATILGISPGTKYIGIAMLRNGDLLECKVKSFKGAWSDEKLEKVVLHIRSMIQQHAVKHIACKTNHESRTSFRVKAIMERVQALALEFEIEFNKYSIDDLKGLFKMHFHNTHILAEHIAKRFPELADIFMRERKSKNKYHYKVFEALAAGLYCHSSISG